MGFSLGLSKKGPAQLLLVCLREPLAHSFPPKYGVFWGPIIVRLIFLLSSNFRWLVPKLWKHLPSVVLALVLPISPPSCGQ